MPICVCAVFRVNIKWDFNAFLFSFSSTGPSPPLPTRARVGSAFIRTVSMIIITCTHFEYIESSVGRWELEVNVSEIKIPRAVDFSFLLCLQSSFIPFSASATRDECEKRGLSLYRHITNSLLCLGEHERREAFGKYRRTRRIHISIKKSNKLLVSRHASLSWALLSARLNRRAERLWCCNNPTLSYSVSYYAGTRESFDLIRRDWYGCVYDRVISSLMMQSQRARMQSNQNSRRYVNLLSSKGRCRRWFSHSWPQIAFPIFVLRVSSLLKHPERSNKITTSLGLSSSSSLLDMICWRISLTDLSNQQTSSH